jgi:cytochrome P450
VTSVTEPAATPPLLDYPALRSAPCPFDPAPEYTRSRLEAPIRRVRLASGTTAWLVTRFDDQRMLMADPRISADMRRPGYPAEGTAVEGRSSITFITMDEPEHSRLRRMLTSWFRLKRIEEMTPGVQRVVDGCLDTLLAGPNPGDLVETVALAIPSLVICDLLGVPYADHDFFQDKAKAVVRRSTTREDRTTAHNAIVDYLDDLVGRKIAEPRDDLLSGLAQRVTDGELTRREAAAMGSLLLVAGHETTANMIAMSTVVLLQHPDQLARVRDTDDPAVVPAAVEELLRYLTIIQNGRRRVATSDIEIRGQLIRAGEGVILQNDAGNRDPEAFPGDPDTLDISRNARGHLAFGFGVHQCLGQPLARLELRVVLSTLFRRIPTLALATGLDELPYKHDAFAYGVYQLPVTW